MIFYSNVSSVLELLNLAVSLDLKPMRKAMLLSTT